MKRLGTVSVSVLALAMSGIAVADDAEGAQGEGP